MNGRISHLLYQLHRHEVLGWSLLRWLALLLIVYAGGAIIHFLPGGRAGATGALVLLLILAFSFVHARRRLFVHFRSGRTIAPSSPAPAGTPIPARVTGVLQVGERHQLVVHAPGHVERFRNNERAISVLVRPSRFLGIGALPARNEGMWYAFVAKQASCVVEVGDLLVQGRSWPALRVVVSKAEEGKRTLYLAFTSDEHLAQVYMLFAT